MKGLGKTAVEFCRECLGWENVIMRGVFHHNHEEHSVCTPTIGGGVRFDYADPNAVTDAVRRWCYSTDSTLEISYYGRRIGEWEVEVITTDSIESARSDDLCHALMAACVAAARKLKANREAM